MNLWRITKLREEQDNHGNDILEIEWNATLLEEEGPRIVSFRSGKYLLLTVTFLPTRSTSLWTKIIIS